MNNAWELFTRRRNQKIANEIHIKYVDDMTRAEVITLPEKLVYLQPNERPLLDCYHSRTGYVLPGNNSAVQDQLIKTMEYCEQNDMVINLKKSKVLPKLEVENTELELVEQMKLLGIILNIRWGELIKSSRVWGLAQVNLLTYIVNK